MPRISSKINSYKMSRIRCKGTSIENIMGKALWAQRLRYRKNYKRLVGTPDFVLIKYRVAIFCDSAFWHGYKNMSTKMHKFKNNKKFWKSKISRNIQRDKEVTKSLRKNGWRVLRFWDFQIKKDVNRCVKKVLNIIEK